MGLYFDRIPRVVEMDVRGREWGSMVLDALRKRFGSVEIARRDPFETLIATILSQHTTDAKAHEAYRRLAGRFGVTVEALASAPLRDVADAIRVAGLQNNKARVIVKLSRRLLEENEFFEELRSLEVEEARRRLMSLPGVGEKTADIVLLFSYGKPTFPIDTHIFRVSKRLGLRRKGEGYERLRKRLQTVFPEDRYLEAHILLIRLGRNVCRPRRPRCGECPIENLCPKMLD
ncbi:endonuclease III [Candidatus Bathyarchaeota archaeon]|nr:endonuclease III [Candidatus Bathyarchaeota archaeon]